MNESDFDVESFRKPHESRHEWDLRRAFILAHHDQFPDNRLLCLANCFVSIECYGCQYPADVMKQMEELGSVAKAGISRRKPMIGQPSGVKFVKSSDGADKKTNPSGDKEISAEKVSESEQSTKSAMNCSSRLIESSVPMSATESKFYSLANCIRKIREKQGPSVRNDAEIIQMAVDKAKMVATHTFSDDANGFTCSLLIDCISISAGEAQNKKAAKHLAFQKAAELLGKPYFRVEKIATTLDDYRLVGSIEPFETSSSPVGKEPAKRSFSASIGKLGQETKASGVQCPAKRRREAVGEKEKRPAAAAGLKELLAEFVVMEKKISALTVLHQSAELCRSEISYEFLDLPDGKSRCTVSLNGIALTDFVGEAGSSLKSEAAEVALEMLKEKCYTVVYKQLDQADASDTVQREAVIGDALQKQAIPESNIGNRLLKKIGWTGGGLGKEGNEGIVEPVSLESAINREGLGLSAERGISADFPLKIANMIQDYMHAEKQEDLVFAPTFSKEERAIIHQQSRKYHLKNKSYGRGNDRYIVLSRKRTPLELVAHIRANGGETKRYILKSPGSS